MNRHIYKKIAKANGVSVEEVKREMKLAIAQAYITPTPSAAAFPCKGKVPTVDEFVNFCYCIVNESNPKVNGQKE